MTSREEILRQLRAAPQPYPDHPPVRPRRHMVPLGDRSRAALQRRFVQEAESLGCAVSISDDPPAAIQHILDRLGDDRLVLSWDFTHIPLPGLSAALASAGITTADPDDSHVRVGLTGVDAALAATGSLVLTTGPGRPRQASMLPPVHIAVVIASQIVPDLETWLSRQREEGLDRFRRASNIMVISGPSRTADIGMELVMGAHGPAALHIILRTDA